MTATRAPRIVHWAIKWSTIAANPVTKGKIWMSQGRKQSCHLEALLCLVPNQESHQPIRHGVASTSVASHKWKRRMANHRLATGRKLTYKANLGICRNQWRNQRCLILAHVRNMSRFSSQCAFYLCWFFVTFFSDCIKILSLLYSVLCT